MSTLLSLNKGAALQAAVSAVCPIVGLAIVDEIAHTVRIDFAAGATGAQQTAANSAVSAFDWTDAAAQSRINQATGASVTRRSGVRKSADEAISSGSFVDCADLKFDIAANTSYRFRFSGAYFTALSTTGLQLSVNGPASPAFLAFTGRIYTTNTTVFAAVGGAYDAAIANTASSGATLLPFDLEGTITTGAAGGVLVLRVRTEVAASAVTIKRGSLGELDAVS